MRKALAVAFILSVGLCGSLVADPAPGTSTPPPPPPPKADPGQYPKAPPPPGSGVRSPRMEAAMQAMTAEGTIMKLEKGERMMVVKLEDGKEMTIYWDASTKVEGDMKHGSMATVKYMKHGEKMMAHSITVRESKKETKKETKK